MRTSTLECGGPVLCLRHLSSVIERPTNCITCQAKLRKREGDFSLLSLYICNIPLSVVTSHRMQWRMIVSKSNLFIIPLSMKLFMTLRKHIIYFARSSNYFCWLRIIFILWFVLLEDTDRTDWTNFSNFDKTSRKNIFFITWICFTVVFVVGYDHCTESNSCWRGKKYVHFYTEK